MMEEEPYPSPCRPSEMTSKKILWAWPPSSRVQEQNKDNGDSCSSGILGDQERGVKAEEEETESKTGKWMLHVNKVDRDENGDTELDIVWKKVVKLVDEGSLYNACCNPGLQQFVGGEILLNGIISCFTEDYTDIDGVKRAADCIRKEIEIPESIFYKAERLEEDGRFELTFKYIILRYKHDTDGSMFSKGRFNWVKRTVDTATGNVSRTDLVSNEPEEDYYSLLKPFKETQPEDEWYKLGTWVLCLDNGTKGRRDSTEYETVRSEVVELARRGELYNTGEFTSHWTNKGFVHCFTNDYSNTADVKRAADVIRRVVHIEHPIFYKDDFSVFKEDNDWIDDFTIARYMHTLDGRLLVRDGHWKPLIPEKVEPPTDHPSTVQSEMVITAKAYRIPFEEKVGKWTLFLDRTMKDDQGQTELDRAWVKVKDLVHSSILLDAVCTTAMDNPYNLQPHEGTIFCYTHDYSNTRHVMATANSIRRAVQLSSDILYERVRAARVEDLKSWNNEEAAIYKHTRNSQLFSKLSWEWTLLNLPGFEDTGHTINIRPDIQSVDGRKRRSSQYPGKWLVMFYYFTGDDERQVSDQLQQMIEWRLLHIVTPADIITGRRFHYMETAYFCYAMSEEKREIRRAAKRIRKAFGNCMTGDMFYISELWSTPLPAASIENNAEYRYCLDDTMWERVHGNNWIPVNFS